MSTKAWSNYTTTKEIKSWNTKYILYDVTRDDIIYTKVSTKSILKTHRDAIYKMKIHIELLVNLSQPDIDCGVLGTYGSNPEGGSSDVWY